MTLGDLPQPLLQEVLKLVDYKSVLRMKAVSKWWLDLISSDKGIWQCKLEHDFGRTDKKEVDLEREYDLEWKIRFGEYTVTELEGHSSPVNWTNSVGSKVVTGSNDGFVRVWNLETGECVHVLTAQGKWPYVQLDEERVAVGTNLGHVSVWALESGELIHTWKAHDGPIFNVELMGGCLVTAGSGVLKLWDIASEECTKEIVVEGFSCLFARDGEIKCGSTSGLVSVFDEGGDPLYTFKGSGSVSVINEDTNHYFLRYADGGIESFDRETLEKVDGITHGRTLLPRWCSKGIEIWDVNGGCSVRTLEFSGGHTCSYNDTKIFVGFDNGMVQVFDFDVQV